MRELETYCLMQQRTVVKTLCISLIVVSAIWCQSATAESPVKQATATKTIPLDQVWAYKMPGTKDVRELEPKLDVHDPKFKELWEHSLIRQIVSFLSSGAPREGENARSGFVVIGAGKKALKEAHAVLKDKNNVDWQQQLPKDTELSLVFFHFATGWHPELDSVEQSHDSIVVRYKFIQPEQPSFGAARFALIPLGKLSPGTVNVKCEQLPPRDYRGLKIKEKPALERLVCDSFSFEVR
ncbi:MAG: hypothetical protein U0805_09605 [Pirellulales bacterium]